MGFTNSEYLWLLALLPVFAGLLFLGFQHRKTNSEAFRSWKFRKIAAEKRPSLLGEMLYGSGMLLAVSLIIVAIAGPYQNDKPVRVPEGPVQACFVVDVSRSMAAEDYREHMPEDAGVPPDLDSAWGSRLQMAKYQIEKVMDVLPGNQLCLVTYTEHGFAQSILDSDFNALRFVLKHWVKIGTAPGDGSNYADGMQVAMNVLKDSDSLAKQKVIILLTDGGFTGQEREVAEAVKRLQDEKVKLVIVGIGMPGENAIPLYANGLRKGQMEKDGKALTTSYEEDAIRNLKAQTNAGYSHIGLDTDSQVVTVDWMTEISGTKIVFEKRMLGKYLAGAAYLIFVIIVATGFFTRRRKVV
jgi:hypothetical protein